TWYDDVRLSQDLNWSDETNYTGAQISALTLSPNEGYNTGTVIVEVSPGSKVGEKAEVTINPETDYVTMINQTKTVTTSEKRDLSLEREHGTNNVHIEGTIPVDGIHSEKWVAVWEPTGYVLDVFRSSLEENGIQLIGDKKIQHKETPQEAIVITEK